MNPRRTDLTGSLICSTRLPPFGLASIPPIALRSRFPQMLNPVPPVSICRYRSTPPDCLTSVFGRPAYALNAALTVIASDLIFCNVFIYASLNWSNCAINFVILSSGFTRSLYFIGLLLSAMLTLFAGNLPCIKLSFSFPCS